MASRACQMGPKMELCTRTRSWWEKKAHAEENPQTGTADARPSATPAPALPRRPNPSRPLPREGSGVKATEDPAPALPDAETLAREIYRLAREQKDTATLLR